MALRDVLFRQSPDKTRSNDVPDRDPRPATKAGRAAKAKAAAAATTARVRRTGGSAPSSGTGRAVAKPAARSTARSAGARTAEPAAKGSTASVAKLRGKYGGKSGAKPLPEAIARRSTADAGAGSAKWWRRPTAGSARKGGPEPVTAADDRAADQVPARQAPLLQRRSFAALLARAAVLAVAFVAMVAFAVALARVTLVPSPASDALVHTNLRPGASIRAYLDQPDLRDIVKQIGGNILLGVPFGILLPALFPRARGLLRVAGFTALVMLLVETAQGAIVEGRAFDIDDVILNTAGALIGYLLIGRRLGRALHPRRVHWWHRMGYGTAPESER